MEEQQENMIWRCVFVNPNKVRCENELKTSFQNERKQSNSEEESDKGRIEPPLNNFLLLSNLILLGAQSAFSRSVRNCLFN